MSDVDLLWQQWGVDRKATDLARSLHAGAWFSIGSLPTLVTSRTGGRRGCKLGATVFNSVYALGLDMQHWELAKIHLSYGKDHRRCIITC